MTPRIPTPGSRHLPVLCAEVVAALAPCAGAVLLDATFGAGGYSRALLDAAPCTLYAIDRDPDARAAAAGLAAEAPGRFVFLAGAFSRMEALLAARGVTALDGVALDVGVSSMQLDEPGRGFSFQSDGPLDMRMAQQGETAADIVNQASEQELIDILRDYGEEPKARRIAKAIVHARGEAPIERTLQLASIVRRAVGRAKDDRHPATQTFQALRIRVNHELEELAQALSAAERLLNAGGRLAVVSFHSLEDRIVKRFFARRGGKAAPGPSRHQPLLARDPRAPSFQLGHGKAITPSAAEVAANPRARSAKLRWAVRTDAAAWPDGGLS